MRFRKFFQIVAVLAVVACDSSSDSSQTGQGGSLSRFAIQDQYLYVATGTSIITYSIAENNFSKLSDVDIGFGLETIIARGDYLYLGARDAMYIYSISDRQNPSFIFRYSHITSCDPVVVQGNRAYVTLRSGTTCNLGSNSLEIIDITNKNNPSLITNYRMTSPGGLGVSGDCLFVCEGEHGMKWLNVSGDKVRLVKEIKDINAYDVIVGKTFVTLTGKDGIYQYSYDCPSETIALISAIPVQRAEL